MILVYTVLIGLASYRLWRLVAEDEIFMHPVEWTLARSPEWFGKMWRCPWCLGLHITVLVSIAWFLWPGWMIYVLVPLGASTIVGIIGERL